MTVCFFQDATSLLIYEKKTTLMRQRLEMELAHQRDMQSLREKDLELDDQEFQHRNKRIMLMREENVLMEKYIVLVSEIKANRKKSNIEVTPIKEHSAAAKAKQPGAAKRAKQPSAADAGDQDKQPGGADAGDQDKQPGAADADPKQLTTRKTREPQYTPGNQSASGNQSKK